MTITTLPGRVGNLAVNFVLVDGIQVPGFYYGRPYNWVASTADYTVELDDENEAKQLLMEEGLYSVAPNHPTFGGASR